ncbi:FAD/NAD(P)-dependent oxidoreductase [Desulforhopalus singaporensis]|uniref:NADPH-dependent 2,4-dienoyl-CoA reductase, sulfur reductase n=1 Tax=Desulforhopalus singaporensis TaxID=91360 RepID=A0A1H0PKX9_9BACT|nr:NAD(P)/FAD-dependent oxidoreductase [Desulforhopalus singaporensis]SDP05256.1 NADPH-dependent 2,4-dienoyl-CoA reductase, sulfur reductase [Desulforhopalus singaporensis]
MENQTDLIIIGGGPAGLAAACSASSCGLEVAVVDEQSSPGGQLFRNIETPLGQSLLDDGDRQRGLELVRNFRAAKIKYYPDTVVWGVEPNRVSCTDKDGARLLHGACVVIAPGAMERPVPFPGWTLPGVITAGGADILLRSGGTLTRESSDPVVLAGNGPLLLLVACHLLDNGVNIAAWLDTGCWPKRFAGGAFMSWSFLDAGYMSKGKAMAKKILGGKIPFVTGVKQIRAAGDTRVERVVYEKGGKRHEIDAACLLRHEGVIPRTHILRSMGALHRWDKVQRYWYPVTDDFGATSIDGIYLAGDANYVHGGDASIIKGTLAGIDVARKIGVITKGEAAFRSEKHLKQLRRIRIARSFLRYMFAPHPDIFGVPDETIVCRCESVTAKDIRKIAKEGNRDVNEVKLHTRCGMGPCQGRMCGTPLAEIVAAAQSTTPDKVGNLHIRQPFRPVSLENYCRVYTEEPADT